MTRDRWLLILLKFVRMFAYGQTTLILVPFLLANNATDKDVGMFMSLTLIGDVVLSALITYKADKAGRRFMLGLSSVMMLLSGVCFMFCTNFWILLLAAVFGVISPSGDEVGPFRSIEESTIAQVTSEHLRAYTFAAQNLAGTLGAALGSLAGGFLVDYFEQKVGKITTAYRVIFGFYVGCGLANLIITTLLSRHTEAFIAHEIEEDHQHLHNHEHENEHENSQNEVDRTEDSSVSSKKLAITLCSFFGIDSLAYGFMSNSWLVEYMIRKFNSPNTVLGEFFFISTFISGTMSFPSAWITEKVGAVVAISATKYGAGLFGGLVPMFESQLGAMSSIWLRSLFDTMDVVPRQVFLTSIIPATERTKILGLVNVTKTLARAIGPLFTGVLAGKGLLWTCFIILAVLEWTFATAVYVVFRNAGKQSGPISV